MKTTIKRLSFKGEELYIGIDVHLRSWTITVLSRNLFIKQFSQEADSERLIKYFQSHYPEAHINCVYEAGYFGFGLARILQSNGINCIIVNPSDIPVSYKHKEQKTDKIDSKKLSELLRAGLLKGIYIPSRELHEDRNLLRIRSQLVRNQAAIKCRIKASLAFYGIKIPEEQLSRYWGRNYVEYLKTIEFTRESGKEAFNALIRHLEYLRQDILNVTRKIRELGRTESYKLQVNKLMSIQGIGIINAVTLLTEASDMQRFTNAKKFRGYLGLIPKEHSSGDTINKSTISRRGNSRLKVIFIESAWVAVRTDPAMTMAFETLVRRMNKSRAIIRIAVKLANRTRHILLTNESYELSIA
jgi:transposase